MDTSSDASLGQEIAAVDQIPRAVQDSLKPGRATTPPLGEAEPATDRRVRLAALESRIAQIEAEIVAMQETEQAPKSDAVVIGGDA